MNYDNLIELLKINSDQRNTYQNDLIKNTLEKFKLVPEEYLKIKDQNLKSNYDFYLKLSNTIKLKFLKKSEKLFEINDIADKMYIVLKGKLSLYLPKSDNIEKSSSFAVNNINYKELFDINEKKMENIINLYKLGLSKSDNNDNEILKFCYKNLKIIDFCKIYELLKNKLIDYEDIYFLINENLNKYFGKYGFKFFKKKYFKQGEMLGEMFWIFKKLKKRSGTVVCLSDSVVGYINKKEYQNLFNNIKFIKVINNFKTIFPKINEDIFIKIIYNFKDKKLKNNEFIFKENSKIEFIYYILLGDVQLIKNNSINMTIVKENEFISEDDIIYKHINHSYSAKINSKEAIIYRWNITNFKMIINQFSSIYNYFRNISILKKKFRITFYNNLKNIKKAQNNKITIKQDNSKHYNPFNYLKNKYKKEIIRIKSSSKKQKHSICDITQYFKFNRHTNQKINIFDKSYYSRYINGKVSKSKLKIPKKIKKKTFSNISNNFINNNINNTLNFDFKPLSPNFNINLLKRNKVYKEKMRFIKNK